MQEIARVPVADAWLGLTFAPGGKMLYVGGGARGSVYEFTFSPNGELTLAREMPTTASGAPWLLAGAKTLSYAVNMAALRYAGERGAGDVIFVSTDGYVLEGPRSTVVIATDDGLQTPPPSLPILHGTTQQALFEVATEKGHRCEYRPLRPADLLAAHGIWLVSSITLAARVHTLDGRQLPHAKLAAELAELVDLAIVRDPVR